MKNAADRVSPDRVSPDRVSPDRVSPDRVSPDRVSSDRVSSDRVSSFRAFLIPTRENALVAEFWWTRRLWTEGCKTIGARDGLKDRCKRTAPHKDVRESLR